MSGNQPIPWKMIGKSILGACHKRMRLCNQDALKLHPDSPEAYYPIIMALSDGHGSPRSFRSDRGSRFAVEAVVELSKTLDSVERCRNIEEWVEIDMPKKLVQQWIGRVNADIDANPFSESEMEKLGSTQAEAKESLRLLAYGATLLLIVVTDTFLLLQQLGDGDILIVYEDGQVERGISKDERLFANQTTSLCMDGAWQEMRTVFMSLTNKMPAVILAATDGYANSFKDDENFMKVGPDFLDMFRKEGMDYVEEHLEGWLTESTEAGSGDDITLGLLYRMEALQTDNHDEQPTPADTP